MSYKKGYVNPSGLISNVDKKLINTFNKKYQNSPIRLGCVVKVYESDDDANTANVGPQYDVVTEQQNFTGSNYVTYQRCISMDGIGGIGDFLEFKLRTSNNEDFEKSHEFKKQNGSMVLLLCLDGFSENAIIIGGVKHPNRESTLTPDAGLHLEGEYNGINWQVNKDGELTVTFKSRTNNEGEPQNTGAGGSYIKMDKTGSIELNDGLSSFIKMDKSAQTMTLESGLDMKHSATGTIEVEAGGNFTALASNFSLNTGQGTAAINTLTMEMSILGEGTIESTLLDIKAQAKMGVEAPLLSLKGNLTQIQGDIIEVKGTATFLGGFGGLPAPIFSTQYVGLGNLGAPVVSAILGPFSTSVFVK